MASQMYRGIVVSVTRRTVVRGAAWSVPVVAIAAQAPAFAASVCGQVPYTQPGWVFVSPASGAVRPNTGGNGLVTTGGIERYRSELDNNSSASESVATNNMTVTATRTLTLVAGRVYTFSFSILSNYGNNNSAISQNQYLQIQLGGVDQLKLVKGVNANTSFGASPGNGYTRLSTTSGAAVTETFSFTYTPAGTPGTSVNVVLRYLFTNPALGKAVGAWQSGADIQVPAPAISAQGC